MTKGEGPCLLRAAMRESEDEVTMESFKEWFQDWAEACSYAQECVPDLSAVKPHEPWSALGTIAIVCFLVWWWNERRLKTTLAREAAAHDAWTPAPAASAPAKTPAPVIDPMRPMSAAPEHKAA
jgi:hypothetical protein